MALMQNKKQDVLQEKEDRLKTVMGQPGQDDQYLAERKDFEVLTNTRLFNDYQKLIAFQISQAFPDRNFEMGQLSYNENGTRDLDTYLAESFISFLFILFECLPVSFVKLMSPARGGPYDVAISKLSKF